MQIVGAESEFVGAAARNWIAKPNTSFSRLRLAVQRRVLQLKLADLGLAANFKLIEQLLRAPGSRVNLWPGLFVSRTKTGTLVLEHDQDAAFSEDALVVDLAGRKGEAVLGDAKFRWHFRTGVAWVGRASSRAEQGGKEFREDGSRGRSPHQSRREFFDADRIGGENHPAPLAARRPVPAHRLEVRGEIAGFVHECENPACPAAESDCGGSGQWRDFLGGWPAHWRAVQADAANRPDAGLAMVQFNRLIGFTRRIRATTLSLLFIYGSKDKDD